MIQKRLLPLMNFSTLKSWYTEVFKIHPENNRIMGPLKHIKVVVIM